MKAATIILALLCVGCIEKQPDRHVEIERGDDGMQQIGSWVWRDTKTSCEWIMMGERLTPRIDATGKQVCGVKP